MTDDDKTTVQPPAGEAPSPPTAPAGGAVALPPAMIPDGNIVNTKGEIIGVKLVPAPSAPARRAWEEWALEKKVPGWAALAACHGRAWPIGQEVTEDEFNAAVEHATNSRIG